MDRGNFAEFVISPLLKNTAPVTVNAQIQIFHLFAGKIIFEDPAGYFELSNHFEYQKPPLIPVLFPFCGQKRKRDCACYKFGGDK